MPDFGKQTFLDVLVQSVRSAADVGLDDQVAPVAILWPDKAREWEPLLPLLRQRLSLSTLGLYSVELSTGPAAWLRCVVSRTLEQPPSRRAIPVLYLPGVATGDLQPAYAHSLDQQLLVDLALRCCIWCRRDGKDWTLPEFFTDTCNGLGISARDDDYTRAAMCRVLLALANTTLEALHAEEPWKAKDFKALNDAEIQALVTLGENERLEFKSTAKAEMKKKGDAPEKPDHRRDGEKKAPPETPTDEAIQAVAGFLNSRAGGTLLIGVQDDRSVCGIEPDYGTFKTTDRNTDYYERWLRGQLINKLGMHMAPFVHISFHAMDGRTVCRLTVEPSPLPVFIGADVFVARTGNETRRYSVSGFFDYYRTHWARALPLGGATNA